jgi:hypothetical protein
MPNARAVAVTGAGHLGPLLLDVDQIASTVIEFWKSLPWQPRLWRSNAQSNPERFNGVQARRLRVAEIRVGPGADDFDLPD